MAEVQLTVLERQLGELARELDQAQSDLADLDLKATQAELRLEIAEARALLSSEGKNAEGRKAEAVLATEPERFEARMAAQQVRAAKGRISTLNARIDVGRSLLSAQKAAWGAVA